MQAPSTLGLDANSDNTTPSRGYDGAYVIPDSRISTQGAVIWTTEVELTEALREAQEQARQSAELKLVKNICLAVTMSMPPLAGERMQHALFTKQMYLDGEITLQRYVMKMRNLFPERMDVLPRELQSAIHAALAEAEAK